MAENYDQLGKTGRSALMARVRQRDTAPELVVRSVLHSLGLRFTVNGPRNRTLPGRPDIVLPARRIVVFVHGCFWHRHADCPKTTTPSANRRFWLDKFAANMARDARQLSELRKLGWRCVVVWECETKKPDQLEKRLARIFAVKASTSPAAFSPRG